MTERNWAGNYAYHAARLHRPKSLDELRRLVAQARKLRALGTRHSFNDIADSPEDLVSLERFAPEIVIDRERRTVTVGGGVRYGQLSAELYRQGFALHNLASLPHISVAGACATGTHGSGDRNGNLATAVAALEFVAAGGEIVTLSRERDGEAFRGAVVALGGLGVVTKLTLNIAPAFEMRQEVYQNLPLERLETDFDAITGRAYSVSLFTDWRAGRINQVWLKRRVTDETPGAAEPALFEATPAATRLHPIGRVNPVNCTEQLGIPGPWHERMPHFRMDYTPSNGDELQSEYLLPRRHAVAALRAIDGLRERIAPLLLISEIRTVAADDLWMSMCYQADSVAIHFTWKPDWPGVSQVLPSIEAALEPFAARPHWGKLFTMPPQRLPALYPKLPEFQALLRSYDPRGVFRNAFLDRYIFAA